MTTTGEKAELTAGQRRALMANADKLACLLALVGITAPNGEMCAPFAPIERETALSRSVVRRCVRALARAGMAEFHNALCNEDGEFRGAGYCITAAGIALRAELMEGGEG